MAELVAVGDDARALLALATTHPLPDVPVQLVVATRAGRPTRHRRTAWLRRMTDRAAQLGPGTVRTDVDSGHLVMLDAPDAVARAVRACLTARRPLIAFSMAAISVVRQRRRPDDLRPGGDDRRVVDVAVPRRDAVGVELVDRRLPRR